MKPKVTRNQLPRDPVWPGSSLDTNGTAMFPCPWNGPCIKARVVDAIVIVILFAGVCLFLGWVLYQTLLAVPG